MDLHKTFLAAVLAEGVDAYKLALERGVSSEFLSSGSKKVWDFVHEYHGKFKSLPSKEVVEGKTGIRVPDEPKEPAEFWVDEVLNFRLHQQITEKVDTVTTQLQARDPQKAYTAYTEGLQELRKEGLAVSKIISLPTLGPRITGLGSRWRRP